MIEHHYKTTQSEMRICGGGKANSNDNLHFIWLDSFFLETASQTLQKLKVRKKSARAHACVSVYCLEQGREN